MLRINLYGGPSIGKSTLAAYIAANLKMDRLGVELVDEFVKQWAYEGRRPQGWDQFYIFASQLHKEEFLFKHGVQTIVTDSPVLLQCCYMNNLPYQYQLVSISRDFDKEFPALHILLEREDFGNGYDETGRIHNAKQAIDKDREIDIMVRAYAKGEIWIAKPSEKEKLLSNIKSFLTELDKT